MEGEEPPQPTNTEMAEVVQPQYPQLNTTLRSAANENFDHSHPEADYSVKYIWEYL